MTNSLMSLFVFAVAIPALAAPQIPAPRLDHSTYWGLDQNGEACAIKFGAVKFGKQRLVSS